MRSIEVTPEPINRDVRDRLMEAPLNIDFRKLREEMVQKAVFARGVRSELVLNAMRNVARESFLPAPLHEFA